jgi:hypothetical protein
LFGTALLYHFPAICQAFLVQNFYTFYLVLFTTDQTRPALGAAGPVNENSRGAQPRPLLAIIE